MATKITGDVLESYIFCVAHFDTEPQPQGVERLGLDAVGMLGDSRASQLISVNRCA